MKNEITGYLSKSNLKNFNNFFKDFTRIYNKKNSPSNKSQNSNYYLLKKPKNPQSLTSRPLSLHYKNRKKIDEKIFENFKDKIRKKLKLLIQSHDRSRNSHRNLILFSNQTNTKSIETERVNSNCIINFVNDYENEFFSDSAYLNLNYNENEIFKNKSVYDKIVKEKIKYLKNNKDYNNDIKYEKNFKYGNYKKEINLTFDSLQISFKDLSLHSDVKDNNLKINLPFSLLPIFYYKGFESFLKFLSIIIKIEGDFENIIFQKDKINDALNNLKDFVKDYTNTDDSDEDIKFQETIKKSVKNVRLITKIKHLKPPILKKNKHFLKYNKFIFFWTSNTRTLVATITLPCIHLNIVENKIMINQFIDYELLFFLYERNFLNWEFYIIKYLSSYSQFRNIFQQISKTYNKNIFLKEPKTKINSFTDEHFMNVYTDQFNKNQIILFKSFYVNAIFIDLNLLQEKIYHIHFNFYHYLKLFQIAEYSNKIFFLIKFFEINKEFNTLNFKYEDFDKFNINTWMANIRRFSHKSLINHIHDSEEELFTVFEILPKKIRVELKRPRWSLIKIGNKEEIYKTCEIGTDLEKYLIYCMSDSGSESWTKLLNECLKRINEPVPILPSIHKKKTRKKTSQNFMFYPFEIDKGLNRRFSKILLK